MTEAHSRQYEDRLAKRYLGSVQYMRAPMTLFIVGVRSAIITKSHYRIACLPLNDRFLTKPGEMSSGEPCGMIHFD